MRITIVLGAFFPVPPVMGGGVEKVWFNLAPEFRKRGHEVVMLSREMAGLPREEMIDGVKHLRVGGFNTPRSMVWLKFLDLIYSMRVMTALPEADVIVTNTFWLPILLRSSKYGKVYVQVARYPKGQTRFYGRAARLQAPSNTVANAIKVEAPSLTDKVAVVPNPIPGAVDLDPAPFSTRDKMILFLGRVHPEKGVHLLVESFARGAQSAFADWQLMIVGPIETKLGGGGESYAGRLKRLAENALGKIVFAGPIFDSAALREIFRRGRLFVYPSLAERGESFGLAPLEAMAHGCPVLVSNLGCFQDFVCDGETGFVFDHKGADPAGLLRARIESVLSNETLLEQVATRGHEKSGEYSVERIADQFLTDFESVIRN